jgi:hypothetical protein
MISTSPNAVALVCPSFSVLSTVSWLLTIFLIFFFHLDPFFSCVRLSVKAHIQSFQPSFLLVQVSCRDSLYLSSPRSSRKDWYLITSEFSVLPFLSFVCNLIFSLFAWDLQFAELLSAMIQAGGSRVVQFLHFLVKGFLTSSRLATGSGEVSNYHIDSEPAHTILVQACLGILLRIQDEVEGCMPEDHPLARYAAEHWMTHAQLGEVSSRLHKGMEYLFDANKPHFKVWVTMDTDSY